jgi:SAM-dependent methyltransferase
MPDYAKILEGWSEHFEWNFVAKKYYPCKILDYGCGYGYSDIWLARRGFEVTGYDPDADRITIAQSLAARENVKVSFTPERDQIDSSFDLAWCSHVLEHVPLEQWPQVMAGLEKGKIILISVPLGRAYDMPEHLHHWNTDMEFMQTLRPYSNRTWHVWEDANNLVIRAVSDARQ